MAKNKDDMKHGTARARLTEDDATRVAYVASTPLEGGFIAESEPIDMFSAAHNIEKAQSQGGSAQPQLNRDGDDDDEADQDGVGTNPNSSSRRLPKKQ